MIKSTDGKSADTENADEEKMDKERTDEKIRELFGQIPGYENPCCLQGDMVISEEYFYDGLYLRLQKKDTPQMLLLIRS